MRFGVWVVAVSAIAASLAGPASAVQFLPHRATYELSARPGSGFGQAAIAEGFLTYELSDGCDAWTINQKAGIQLTPNEGAPHAFDWTQASWEAKDGSGYRYSVREARDGEVLSQKRGEVKYASAGGEGTLTTELPQRREVAVPSALLPMAHSAAILEHALAGEPVFVASIFDGSLAETPVEVSAVITGAEKGWRELEKSFPPLEGQISRQVDLAFYIEDRPDGTPDFEQRLRIFDNGVVGELTFEFAGLEVEGKLLKLEPLQACN